jgi:transposase InsO family protein
MDGCPSFPLRFHSWNDKAEKIALFRYGLIASLVLETLPRGELTRRAQEIAARLYDIPYSTRRQVSVDTLLEWTLRYRRNGIAALHPKPRQDRGQLRAITAETAALIERLKRESPSRTGTALLFHLALADPKTSSGRNSLHPRSIVSCAPADAPNGNCCWTKRRPPAYKKYEAEFANQTWQSDMLFGPWVQRPAGGRMQVFLQATLDDASRLIPHAQFYPDQGLDSFLDCLRQAVSARGIPTRLYMDNAKIYRSPQLARIAASIGILIIHTPPYQPEGRGKIERFFRSVREQFLADLDPKALLSLDQLNERLWHWLDTVYHRREHSVAPNHAAAALAARHRPGAPTAARHRHAPPVLSSRGSSWSAATPPSCCAIASLKRRRSWPAKRVEVRFDPLDLAHVEIYCDGQAGGRRAPGGRGRQRKDLPVMFESYSSAFKKDALLR